MLSGSELWLLRLMADRGLALLDASSLLVVIEERGELRVAAAAGEGTPRLRIMPVEGSALGAVYRRGEPLALDRPRGSDAAWLHELGLDARAALVEPLAMEDAGGGLVIALRRDGRFRGPDRSALQAFATSVAQRLAAERSVEIERLRYGMEARERERTRWAREIHDETVQGLGALRLKLATARDAHARERVAAGGGSAPGAAGPGVAAADAAGLSAAASGAAGPGVAVAGAAGPGAPANGRVLDVAVDEVLEGLGHEIEGLRHLITELRPAALDDLGLEAALQALARRAQARDGLEVRTELDLGAHARLDAELESTVYRVVQEALTNVSRHAQATRAVVSVGLLGGGAGVRVSVVDDGRGLPAGGSGSHPPLGPRGDGLEGGYGMSGMRERAELVGGELALGPAPGGGAEVRLTVPLAGRPAVP